MSSKNHKKKANKNSKKNYMINKTSKNTKKQIDIKKQSQFMQKKIAIGFTAIVLFLSALFILFNSNAENSVSSTVLVYNNQNSGLKSNNVKDALDELNSMLKGTSYTPANNISCSSTTDGCSSSEPSGGETGGSGESGGGESSGGSGETGGGDTGGGSGETGGGSDTPVDTRSSNNNLKSLKVLVGEKEVKFDKEFSSETLEYIINVSYSTEKVTIVAEVDDENAVVAGAGETDIAVGENVKTINVQAENEQQKVYTLKIVRAEKPKSTNTNLESLAVKNGENIIALSPAFKKSTTKYTASVPFEVASVTIEAKASEEVASVALPENTDLALGKNELKIVVTAEDTTKTKEYTITITRKSNNDFLKSLELTANDQPIPFNPVFNKDETSYSTMVANSINKVNIKAVAEDDKAEVTGDGSYKLDVGSNNIAITVTAEDGKKNIYNLKIVRQDPKNTKTLKDESSNSFLSELTVIAGGKDIPLDPEFAKEITSYIMYVKTNITSVKIDVNVEDTKAKANVIGPKTLNVGDNIYSIIVTAEDGSKKAYTLKVIREGNAKTDAKKKKSNDIEVKTLISAEGEIITDSASIIGDAEVINANTKFEVKMDNDSDKNDVKVLYFKSASDIIVYNTSLKDEKGYDVKLSGEYVKVVLPYGDFDKDKIKVYEIRKGRKYLADYKVGSKNVTITTNHMGQFVIAEYDSSYKVEDDRDTLAGENYKTNMISTKTIIIVVVVLIVLSLGALKFFLDLKKRNESIF